MPYPTAWRPRPSMGGAAAAVLPRGFIPSVTLPRFNPPPFRPGRHFPGLLLAGAIFDMAFSRAQYELDGGDGGMSRTDNFDMSGWVHLCGPVGAPANHGYPIVNTWSVALPAGWNGGGGPGVCGLANQALSGEYTQMSGARARYRWWTKTAGVGAGVRFAVAEEWGRNPASGLAPARQIPVVPVEAVNIPGVLIPATPLTPVRNRALPLGLTPQTWPIIPGDNDRGYFVGTVPGSGPEDRPVRFANLIVAAIGPDVKPWYPDPERKVPINSRAGQALTQAFKLLSMYGTSEAFINALWRALPSWARARHARNGQKLADLAANWGEVDLGDAFANSLMVGVNTAVAGALYGTATRALTDAFGQGAGFGLYRAWSTGEFAYSTSSSFNPHRAVRGGGSVGESQLNPRLDRSWRDGNRYVSGDSFSYNRRRAEGAARYKAERRRRRRNEREAFRRNHPVAYRNLQKYRAKRREERRRGAEARRRRARAIMARGF